MTAQNIVKKMSVKTVYGKIDPKSLDPAGSKLFRIAGIARALKSGSSNFGDYTALVGDFAAIKNDGEIIRAPTLFVPDVVLDMIAPAVEQSDGVEFALDIVAIPDATVAVGYRYAARTVFEPAQNDPMAGLMGKLQALEHKPETTGKKGK